jgi:hypothetical protein
MSILTPEQIDMLIKLQSLFKKKMGEWQVGDSYVSYDIKGIILHRRIGYTEYSELKKMDMYEVLRIPKPIDWQNPERGLWGMLKGYKSMAEGTDCVVYCFDNDEGIAASDPFTALLKALVEQEGI